MCQTHKAIVVQHHIESRDETIVVSRLVVGGLAAAARHRQLHTTGRDLRICPHYPSPKDPAQIVPVTPLPTREHAACGGVAEGSTKNGYSFERQVLALCSPVRCVKRTEYVEGAMVIGWFLVCGGCRRAMALEHEQ